MDAGFYTVVVALVAIVYSIIARKIQYKYGNQKVMEALNVESKKLNEEYKKASARNDKKEMDRIMKRQMELLGSMWKGVFGQFKILIPILIIFFILTWGVNQFDPNLKDDVTIELKDDGIACDSNASDGTYSGCYILKDTRSSVWVVDAKVYNEKEIIGENVTAFVVGEDDVKNAYLKPASGKAPPEVSTDKQTYLNWDKVKITAILKEGNAVTATLNNGTSFYVDLPLTIPLLNIKRINEAYWWFIFVTIIFGILLTIIVPKIGWLKEVLS